MSWTAHSDAHTRSFSTISPTRPMRSWGRFFLSSSTRASSPLTANHPPVTSGASRQRALLAAKSLVCLTTDRLRSRGRLLAPAGIVCFRSAVPLALRARSHRLPLRGRQLDLAEPDRLRRHFDRLVVADEFERLLERQRPRR